MRPPHTIPAHAFEAFRCSEETSLLGYELERRLRSEDEEWEEAASLPPSLRIQALEEAARNWHKEPVDLEDLPTLVDRDKILEVLPLDLPFELSIARIPYERYWERAAEARWRFNDPQEHGGSWRRLYCERHLAEYLERLEPQYFEAETDKWQSLLGLVAEHVRCLRLRQLLPLREKTAKDFLHIKMDQILPRLPHLEEIYVNVGMIHLSDGVEWRAFEFSVDDSARLGRGLKTLRGLRKFSLTRSKVDRPNAAAILQGLALCPSLEEIDFSHCQLANEGAHAIGAFLRLQRINGRLKVLRLGNNGIGSAGLAGFVCGLLEQRQLRRLDLRLNPLTDAGADHIAAMLLRYPRFEYLNVSGCSFGTDGGLRIAQALASGLNNFAELRIDCSNNEFGSIAGEAFEIVAKACGAISMMDVRMCGFLKESEYSISENVSRNRAKLKKERAQGRRRSTGVEMQSQSMRSKKTLVPPPEFAAAYQSPRYDSSDYSQQESSINIIKPAYEFQEQLSDLSVGADETSGN